MVKTNNIFNEYFTKYNVIYEDVGEDSTVPDTDPMAGFDPMAGSPPVDAPKPLDVNEKIVIKILANAFIFNPSVFSKNKQKYILNKIDDIKKIINKPISKIIHEIKKIIRLDKSLQVESKTLDLISDCMLFIEKEKDATDIQDRDSDIEVTDKDREESNNDDGGKITLTLNEIFPLYKELILQALRHIPTDEELMIVKPVINEFGDIDPEKIVTTIQTILNQSLEDDEVQDELSNI